MQVSLPFLRSRSWDVLLEFYRSADDRIRGLRSSRNLPASLRWGVCGAVTPPSRDGIASILRAPACGMVDTVALLPLSFF